jgi:phosphatidylserine/phosphatidylglycerophosphate/cardiolipin synthase-like enzyme
MEVKFSKPSISINSVSNLFTNEKVSFTQLGTNSISIDSFYPSEFIKINYSNPTGRTVDSNNVIIATPSASTGTMNVYFNHPVDVSFAQIQNAVNLSNNLDAKLITYMNSCQSSMDIAIYSSYSPSATTGIAGAINAAYTRGVKVRVIYDGTASNLISLLNSNIPRLPSPTTSAYTIMHNKFVIFDANNADATIPYVWTGSTNWTTSQIDGPDKNNVIVIQDQALALGYKIEFDEMWGGSGPTPNLANSKFGQFKTDNTPHHYIIGGKTVDSYFSPSDGTTAKIVAAINTANTDIEAAVMDITRTDCSGAIINRFNAGVTKSYVLVDSQNPSGNQITTLQNALTTSKAAVYNGTGIMHHKFMVVDNYNSSSDPLVVLGSHNWSTGAETKNDENTLIVHDLNIANQYFQAFAYLFQLSGGVFGTTDFKNEDFALYPNPSTGIFNMETKNENPLQATVYNILGQKVWNKPLDALSNTTIDLSTNSKGIYLLVIENGKTTKSYKLIKE